MYRWSCGKLVVDKSNLSPYCNMQMRTRFPIAAPLKENSTLDDNLDWRRDLGSFSMKTEAVKNKRHKIWRWKTKGINSVVEKQKTLKLSWKMASTSMQPPSSDFSAKTLLPSIDDFELLKPISRGAFGKVGALGYLEWLWVGSFIPSYPIHAIIPISCIHSWVAISFLVRSFMHSFTHSLIHSLTHSRTHSRTHASSHLQFPTTILQQPRFSSGVRRWFRLPTPLLDISSPPPPPSAFTP